MTLSITSIYATALVPIFLVLWLQVSKRRAALSVSIGHNNDVALHEKIRRHGNFIEWVPLVLILLALAELNAAPAWVLHSAGVALVAGRVVHPLGLHAERAAAPLRIVGNATALLAMALLMSFQLWALFGMTN